jgi:hypothetical protein
MNRSGRKNNSNYKASKFFMTERERCRDIATTNPYLSTWGGVDE